MEAGVYVRWRLKGMRPYQVGKNLINGCRSTLGTYCVRLLAQRSDEAHRLVPTCHCDGEEGYEEPCATTPDKPQLFSSLSDSTCVFQIRIEAPSLRAD